MPTYAAANARPGTLANNTAQSCNDDINTSGSKFQHPTILSIPTKNRTPKNWAKEDGTDLAAVTTFSNLVRSLAPRAPASLGKRREVCGVYKIQTEKNQTTPEQPQQSFHVMQCIT
jgi:hypothetical protein